MSKIAIGIDPGMSGGVAVLVDGKPHKVYKMPVFQAEGSKAKHIDAGALIAILEPVFKNNTPTVYMEELTHLHGLPATSNFKLGYSYGIIQGILQTFGEFYLVSPRKWQNGVWKDQDKVYKKNKYGNLDKTKAGKPKVNTKATSFNAANRIWPDGNFLHDGGRVAHDGCIDALLIAYYGEELC